jgi:hypothetical protein
LDGVDVITDLKKLSKALDEAAPGRRLAAEVRSHKDRIEREVRSKGFSEITVNGRKFRVVSSTAKAMRGR